MSKMKMVSVPIMEEITIEVDTTPKWENLMPWYFDILSQTPKSTAQQKRIDFVKGEIMRMAKNVDDNNG